MKKRLWTTTNYGVSIYPLCLLGEVLYYDFHKLFGKDLAPTIGEFKDGINRFASLPGDRDEMAQTVLTKVLKNKTWVKIVLKKTYALCNDLLVQSKKSLAPDLARKSDQAILSLYRRYNEKFRQMYLYGWLANVVEGDSDIFSHLAEKELMDRLNPLGKASKIGEYFTVLTTLPLDSVRDRERKDFLKLLAKAKKEKNLEKLFSRHQKKYCWLQYDYDGPALSLDYFVAEAKSLLKAKVKPSAELKKIAADRRQLIKKQQQYQKDLELNRRERYIFWLARQFSFIKNYRKDVLYQSYFENDFLIKEIGRRLGLSLKQAKHILPAEMPLALLKKKCDPEVLNQRLKHSVIVYGQKGIEIYIGQKAKEIIKQQIDESKEKVAAAELSGQIAFSGRAIGRVRIVNVPAEMKDFKNGEILVSEKTNPNLINAMKKAAAIVTDAGGLTCHAAIVSRELKIPCIVGTKLATKVLNNGDKIEVDADKGIIKMITARGLNG